MSWKRILLIPLTAAAFWPAGAAGATAPQVALTLDQAVEQAVAHSHKLQAKHMDLAAAQARLDVQNALLGPRLSLEASWRYVTTVQKVPAGVLSRMQPEIKLGDHNNYSVGPMLSWDFWGSGATYFSRKAAEAQVQSKQEDLDSATRQLRLQTRLSYFQVQLALAQSRLIANALKLSQAQYQDIGAQAKAGQASRIDLLSSHQETLNNRRQLRQARTDLAAALRDLFNVIGQDQEWDVSYPAEAGSEILPGQPQPTVLVQLDPLEQSLTKLAPAEQAGLDPNPPQAQVLWYLSESSQQLAQSLGTSHWPKLQASAKTSLDYPNGPTLEAFNQNTFSVAASWSLWEWGRVSNQVQEQRYNSQSSEGQRQQLLRDLGISWQKARDQLAQLRETGADDAEAVRETETLSRLIYDSYRAGRAGFLDVQSANYRALGAKIQAVRTQVQMLIQLAALESMARPVGAAANQ